MKKTLCLLVLLTSGIAFAQDIRFVSGRPVDLQPVRNWMEKKAGERPLKHWKQIFVIEIKKEVSGGDQCSILTESGDVKEILIAHCDQIVRDPLIALMRIESKIALAEARMAVRSGPRAPAPTAEQEGWMRHFEAEDRAKRTQEINSLEKARDAILPKAKEAAEKPLLAMFTGLRSEDLEIWDCGIPQARR